jgi:hypothetical protein
MAGSSGGRYPIRKGSHATAIHEIEPVIPLFGWWLDSITCFAQLTAAMTQLGSAVHAKGLCSHWSLSWSRGLCDEAALEASSGELGEKPFGGVQPR